LFGGRARPDPLGSAPEDLIPGFTCKEAALRQGGGTEGDGVRELREGKEKEASQDE